MPKIIIHSPKGTFNASVRRDVAAALTELALDCEQLPPSPFVKSTVWIYFGEHTADAVFMGDQAATWKIVTLQIYVIKGGLDDDGKRKLIEGATVIVGRYSGTIAPVPAYIVIHEIEESNWGIFGKNPDLAALRASSPDAPAFS